MAGSFSPEGIGLVLGRLRIFYLLTVWALAAFASVGAFAAFEDECAIVVAASDATISPRLFAHLEALNDDWTHRDAHSHGYYPRQSVADVERGAIVDLFRAIRVLSQRHLLLSQSTATDSDPEWGSMVEQEQREIREAIAGVTPSLRKALLRRLDPAPPAKATLVQLHAPSHAITGQYFLGRLTTYVVRVAERQRYAVELVEAVSGEKNELRQATLRISGAGAYERFRLEAGGQEFVGFSREGGTRTSQVHRNRVDVIVAPELEELSGDIPESEFDFNVTTATGPGGQHVNKTESAVIVKHRETGIQAVIQSERSQHQNRATALALARSRVRQKRQLEQKQDQLVLKRAQLGGGGLAESVRVFREQDGMVTDRRTKTKFNFDEFLRGELSESYLDQLEAYRLLELSSVAAHIP